MAQTKTNNWKVSTHMDNGDIVVRDSDNIIIANCEVDGYEINKETAIKNAKLIAAAPSLLEVVNVAMAYIGEDMYHYEDVGDDDALESCQKMFNRLKKAYDKATK